ncbi:MAG TPA: hypothetical protein VK711_16075 [Puia sp.]|nr:hypothetical protein [Puia sp.]
MTNLRQDPFERLPSARGEACSIRGGGYMNDFYVREFWCFVDVQNAVTQLAATSIEFPPMQAPVSFNLTEVYADRSYGLLVYFLMKSLL